MSARIDAEGFGSEVRTARASHGCDSGGWSEVCVGVIRPGDRYVRHVASPRIDGGSGRWQSANECAPCHLDRKRGGRTW